MENRNKPDKNEVDKLNKKIIKLNSSYSRPRTFGSTSNLIKSSFHSGKKNILGQCKSILTTLAEESVSVDVLGKIDTLHKEVEKNVDSLKQRE